MHRILYDEGPLQAGATPEGTDPDLGDPIRNCHRCQPAAVECPVLDLGDPLRNRGKMVFADGSVYEGELKDDLPNGRGKFVSPGGNTYEGEWKGGMMSGFGRCVSPDGSTYEGEWKDGVFQG